MAAGVEVLPTTIGGRSIAYAAIPRHNRIGITIGGTRYFIVYSAPPSRSAQAVATAVFGQSVPGTVAQPPFSMIERRSHDEETFLNSTSLVAASAWRWNFSTQIGARTPTTAV